MNHTPLLHDSQTLEKSQQILGELINLGQPASEAVTRRALADQRYAHYLLITKDIPELRDKLLLDPRNESFESDGSRSDGLKEVQSSVDGPSGNIELIFRTTSSFLAWGKSGFKLADQNLLDKRLQACERCEFLTDPPKKLIYLGLELVTGKRDKICKACGCFVKKKAMLPSEKCPKQDPVQPNLSRWGELWVQNT